MRSIVAVCFSSHVNAAYLAASAAVTGALTFLGNKRTASVPVFAIGGGLLWFALLSAGVNADIAGVIAGLAVSTQAQTLNADGATESFSER